MPKHAVSLEIKVFIEFRIAVQKLLKCRPGAGTRVMDPKTGSCQSRTAVPPPYNNPMLASVNVSGTQKHRLSLLQLFIYGRQIAVPVGNGPIVLRPIDVPRWGIAKLMDHGRRSNGGAGSEGQIGRAHV